MKTGWTKRLIGELCEIVGGGTPSKSNAAFFGGDIPWATVRDMKSDWIDETDVSISAAAVKASATNILPASTVVIASRVGLGKVCRVTHDTAINQDLRGFIPKAKSQLEADYLFWWLKSVAQDIVAAGRGATVQGVTLPFLRALKIPLPCLGEQRRCVAMLDEAFAGIAIAAANTKKNLASSQALFESSFSSIFNEGDDWEEVAIIELVNRKILDKPTDGNHGEIHPKKSDFVESGIPFVMASDLREGSVDLKNCYFLPEQLASKLRKGFAKNNDILISHKGTIGRVAILYTDYKYVMLTPQVTYYRVLNTEVINPRYLYFAMQEPAFQRELNRVASGGSTRSYIGITAQLDLKIRFPSLERQASIVKKLEYIAIQNSSLRKLYDKKIAAFIELEQSLLQRVFAGELS